MSGVYWALTALATMNEPAESFRDVDELVAWVHSCYKPQEGSFSPNTLHDGNLLSTLSAVQIMALLGRLEELDADKIVNCALFLLALRFMLLVPLPIFDATAIGGAVHQCISLFLLAVCRTCNQWVCLARC